MQAVRSEMIQTDRYDFKGLHGCRSYCSLIIQRLLDGRTLVICTELEDNPGTSVTNAAEIIASRVASSLALDPAKMVWIEHYPPGRLHGKTEDWDLVTFASVIHDGVNTIFGHPSWHPMRREDWECLGISVPVLFP